MGEMAVALMKGVQFHNVMACAKHYALNSIENSRYEVDVQLDERTLREVYLPHFKKCVDNGVASIMSAYNRVRGEYCGHNRYLLTSILRDDWGFRGFVTSDWMNGLRDGLKGVKAGMDIEMPTPAHYGENLLKLVAEGAVSENEIDEMVFRILRTKLDYVTREDPMTYEPELIASPEHTALAREVAEQSMVLLKNSDSLLPLSRAEVGRIAVVGRLANVDNTGDHGSSHVRPPYLVTPLQGLKSAVGDDSVVTPSIPGDVAQVREAAADADVVVVVVGVAHDEEGEYIDAEGDMRKPGEQPQPLFGFGPGGDRVPLSLRDEDVEVIRAACSANPKCVVALIGGSAITMEEWVDQTPAVLMAWYFGMEGGNALAKVLFGEVNPAGRLPFTIPRDESQLPPFDPYAREVEYGYYHGYTLFDREGHEAAFPFGFGLSYTTFAFQNLEITSPAVEPGGSLEARVEVTNSGPVAGRAVPQLYVGFSNSSVDRPHKLLRGFRKIALAPGETRVVRFQVPAEDLAWYNPEASRWEVEEMVYQLYVGPSADDRTLLKAEFEIRPNPLAN